MHPGSSGAQGKQLTGPGTCVRLQVGYVCAVTGCVRARGLTAVYLCAVTGCGAHGLEDGLSLGGGGHDGAHLIR